jgi:hypothetical protein
MVTRYVGTRCMARAKERGRRCGTEQISRNGVDSVDQAHIGTSANGVRSPGKSVLWGGFARKGVTTLDIDAHQARDRAEAIFKKKQERLLDGQKATAEYEAARLATREKTARLRALRLARDVARKTPVPPAQTQSA